MKRDILHHPYTRAALPFINGGLAGMVATTVIQPIDMIKVRLQLAGEGARTGPKPTPITVTKEILASGRALDLYTGLSAGLLRQAVYTTARIGLFDTFMKSLAVSTQAKGNKVGFKERAAAGLSAGGLAAMMSMLPVVANRNCTDDKQVTLRILPSFACNPTVSNPLPQERTINP